MDAIVHLWRYVGCCRLMAAEEVGDEDVEQLLFAAETLLMQKMRRRARKIRKAKRRGDDRRTD